MDIMQAEAIKKYFLATFGKKKSVTKGLMILRQKLLLYRWYSSITFHLSLQLTLLKLDTHWSPCPSQ